MPSEILKQLVVGFLAMARSYMIYIKGLLQPVLELIPPFPQKPVVISVAIVCIHLGVLFLFIRICGFITSRLFRKKYANRGEKFFAKGNYQKAKDYFLKTGNRLRAAQACIKLGEFLEAATYFDKLSKHDMAARYYAQAGENDKAAIIYEKSGRALEAAETYERGGNFIRAADLYRQLRHFKKAEEMYDRIQYFGSIGDMWAKEVQTLRAKLAKTKNSRETEKYNESIKQMALRAGDNYTRVPDHKKAAELYALGDHKEKAASSLEALGEFEQAAEAYLGCGKQSEAASCFLQAANYKKALTIYTALEMHAEVAEVMEKMGKNAEAAEYRAQIELKRGEKLKAAQQFEHAGRLTEAATLYLELNDNARAAQLYEQANEPSKAAQVYENSQEYEKAAECYAASSRFTAAAKCYRKVGNEASYVHMLLKGEAFLEAGIFLHDKDEKQAITILQKIDQDSPDYRYACNLLGRIFLKKDNTSLAKEKLEKAVAGQTIGRRNLEFFYDLAELKVREGELQEAIAIYDNILSIDYHYKDVLTLSEKAKNQLSDAPVSQALSVNSTVPTGALGESDDENTINQRYCVEKEIGRGGMGVVYKAWDSALERAVALKFLPSDLSAREDDLNKFLNEARSAARLSHANIVTVYDIENDVKQQNYFIVMEYVDGANLKEIIEASQNLPFGVITMICEQICNALGYAHQKNVVHRDIKTANILWTNEKVVKITDFGLAKILEDSQKSSTKALGSPVYMSPEQVLGKPVDARSDIYSLGITLYEMVTGRVPFDKGDIGYHHINTEPTAPEEYRDGIPGNLSQLIQKCISKDPGQRYQTAKEIIKALA